MSLFVPMPFVASKITYASALAAITNKTIILDASISSAANADTLTTTPFANTGSAGGNFVGNATWRTNIQNGFRAVRSTSPAQPAEHSTLDLGTAMGESTGTETWTIWLAGSLSGTSSGAVVAGGGGTFGPIYVGSSRALQTRFYNGSGYTTQDWGASFTDGAPFVASVRANSSGDMRVNFNGTVYSFSPSLNQETFFDAPTYALRGRTSGTDYLFEEVWSSDSVSNAVQDNFVTALKTKWSIA